mgnify:CR=1 FL=1
MSVKLTNQSFSLLVKESIMIDDGHRTLITNWILSQTPLNMQHLCFYPDNCTFKGV